MSERMPVKEQNGTLHTLQAYPHAASRQLWVLYAHMFTCFVTLASVLFLTIAVVPEIRTIQKANESERLENINHLTRVKEAHSEQIQMEMDAIVKLDKIHRRLDVVDKRLEPK